jgi:hypothetical protein
MVDLSPVVALIESYLKRVPIEDVLTFISLAEARLRTHG